MRRRAFHASFHEPRFPPEQLAVLDRAFNDAADALFSRLKMSEDARIRLAQIIMAIGEEQFEVGRALVPNACAGAITTEAIDRFEAARAPDQ